MKKMVTATMLMPAYAGHFNCTGSDCEDSCCIGWNIALDKESFLHYQSSFHPVLRPKFRQYVKRNPKAKSEAEFGLMGFAHDDCRDCGLLKENRLCEIQEKLGETALSDTCKNYPRKVHLLGGLHQMTLMLSCPEAARLALLDENAFEFIGQDHSINQNSVEIIKPIPGISLAQTEDIRTLMFQILRSGDLPLPHKLKVVGLVCERLSDLIKKKSFKAIPSLLNGLEQGLADGTLVNAQMRVDGNPELQAQVAVTFFLSRSKSFQTAHQRRIFDEIRMGLGVQEDGTLDRASLPESYLNGQTRLASSMKQVPWLLEHYVLNEALREVFPWGRETPERHFATLMHRFVTVRLMLVGRAAARDTPLTPSELAETIQVHSRLYLHQEDFSRSAEKILEETGWHKLDQLYSLL